MKIKLLNSEFKGRLQAAEDETPKISIKKLFADLEECKMEKENHLKDKNKMEEENLILKKDSATIKVQTCDFNVKDNLCSSRIKIKTLEEEKSRLALKYLKEREHFKIKITQVCLNLINIKMEMQDEFQRKEIRNLNEELKLAKSSLADVDIKYQNRLNDALL